MIRRRNTHFIGWIHDSTFVDPNYKAHQRHEYPWSLLTQELAGCDYCVISVQRQGEIKKLFGTPASRLPVVPDGIDVPGLLGLTPMVSDLFLGRGIRRQDPACCRETWIPVEKTPHIGDTKLGRIYSGL